MAEEAKVAAKKRLKNTERGVIGTVCGVMRDDSPWLGQRQHWLKVKNKKKQPPKQSEKAIMVTNGAPPGVFRAPLFWQR